MSASTVSSSLLLALMIAAHVAPAAPQEQQLVFYPDDPLLTDHDTHDIQPPEESDPDALLTGMAMSMTHAVDSAPPSALNINTLDEVPDSSWFTNRHGRQRMTLDALRRGPNSIGPPAAGEWRVTGHPSDGRTPKFTIEDAEGRAYYIKLDSPGHAELASSAEVIGTKFFHAFGYNVPENHVVYFDPANVVITDADGQPAEYSLAVLDDAPRDEQGRVRAVASRMLEGTPMGPFSYVGTRPDDPNDIFPHQHRRELRGMAVFSSWLNHTDTKAANSLDILAEADGRRFLRHYLIDFGSILGSGASGAKSPVTGYERYIEIPTILTSVASLGLWARPYVEVDYPPYSAVGNLEADFYQPELWRPPFVNPAFELMDAADAFWAARIVSRFDNEDIRAIVSTARISNPDAETAMVDILQVRRNKVVRYWLTRTNPLEGFRIEDDGAGPRLLFENAAVQLDLAGPVGFRSEWYRLDNATGQRHSLGPARADDEGNIAIPAEAWGEADRYGLRYAEVHIGTVDYDYPHWREPVVVTLRLAADEPSAESIELVGVQRPRMPSP